MGKIQILPENLINLIAAGEVVERPASVLKELLENSIDAGSTEIKAYINEYGLDLIRVSDNGVGMGRDDALLSLQQHATSKVKSSKDLDQIMTFGFRGEALASISSIAEKVEVQTKAKDTPPVLVVHSNNKIEESRSHQQGVGTNISVFNIFKNVPARKKFLKTNETELKHIINTFIEVAIPNISIHFELYHNNKLIHRLTRTNDIKQRLFEIWGASIVNNLLKVENTYQKVNIEGYVTSPFAVEKRSTIQYLFINNRFVKSGLISAAILQAFHGHIHRDLRPSYILNLKIPPSDLDVNVHPRKLEVKFDDEQMIFKAVLFCIKSTIEKNEKKDFISSIESSYANGQNVQPIRKTASYSSPNALRTTGRINEKGITYGTKERSVQTALSFTSGLYSDTESQTGTDNAHDYHSQEDNYQLKDITYKQFLNTYIAFENSKNELIFVDQHAAAEKVSFEKLYEQREKVITKPLLVPEVVDFKNSVDRDLILEKSEILIEMGVKVEGFGAKSIQILEIPELLNFSDYSSIFNEILSEYDHESMIVKHFDEEDINSRSISKQEYLVLATIACHGSIRAGQKLTQVEMSELVSKLFNLKNPGSCPHGRPTYWKLSKHEIERHFKRDL